jgi:ATP-dependent RNA helicase DeaD
VAPRAVSAPAERAPARPVAAPATDGGLRPARRPVPPAAASPAWTPDDRDGVGDFTPGPANRRDRRGNGESPWYRVNVGRRHNADPRWLIPIICRRGRVEKSDIGNIRIQENETFFQIGAWAAGQFEAFAWRPDRKDPQIRFATGD